MSKARELAELSRTVSDSADAVAITIDSSEDVSFSEDIKLGDGKKAIFGAGSDLQIYHNGSDSFISDQGTGRLNIQSATDLLLANTANTQNYIYAVEGGAVNLYYSGSKKFETTATGIDVTGTATMGNVGISTANPQKTLDVQGEIAISNSATSYWNLNRDDSTGALTISDTGTQRFTITPAGDLGLGTQSPNSYGGYSTLTINGTTGGLIDLEANGTLRGEVYAEAGGLGLQAVGATNITFKTNYTERFKIDSGGALTGTCFNASTGEYSGNLNDLKKTGFYRSENSNTNNPSYAYYSVVVYGNQGNVTAQIATLLSGPATYVRSFNTSWTSWVRIDD